MSTVSISNGHFEGNDLFSGCPSHWSSTKLKFVTRFRNGFAFKPHHWTGHGIPIIRIQNLNGSNEFNYAPDGTSPESLRIWPGDLVFSWSGNKGTSFGPFIWDRNFDGYLNQHIFKLDGYTLPQRYFYYLLKAVTADIESRTHGIIGLVHVTKPELGNTRLRIPPPDEQAAIVRFLDSRLEEIDRFIANKRRLIDLLIEHKQCIRSEWIVHGLGSESANLTNSGIWCEPRVRRGWSVTTLGRLTKKTEQGWSPVAANGELREDQWGILTLSAVKKGKFYCNANKPLPDDLPPKPQYEVRSGDFLLTRSNTKQLVGDACVVDHTRPKLMLCDLIYRLILDEEKIFPRFLLHQLLSRFGRTQIESDARGSSSTMVKVSQGHIARWNVFLPPRMDEQMRIVSHIDKEHEVIDGAIYRAQKEIDLLNEFRASLIAEAITGKIDVRSKT